ncbi:U3 small nucleolar RNA-associated protein 6 homolog [Littorina saxatilis]|uniref:U3 small nucleolar RNA-associated protein 6 homolog n=1 Tax=Littorina saxatilis TaxID=31220 RepID=UPI0038B58D93
MAEFVQQSLCQIKDELENIHELTNEEKRKIYQRQTKFEYRIRRRRKSEEDFLQYILYQQDILKLLSKRKRCGRTKRGTEVPIIFRIHNLFQLCETRFPQNADVWLSHIEFCKKQKEYSRVTRLFKEMLRLHPAEPELWIQAARWEVEQSNLEAARALMQRCLSYNKTSRLAWVEYYKLEIELAKMEEEPTGKIAQLVYAHACQELPDDVDLLLEFIKTAQKTVFMKDHAEQMLKQLREEFSHLPRVWDFLARRVLPTKQRKLPRLTEQQEEKFFAVYQQAVSRVPTTEMWTLYLRACLEFVSLPTPSQDRVQKRANRALEVFQAASEVDCLSVDMFQAWVFFLKDLLRVEEAVGVSERMVQRFPDSPAAWTQRLVLHFQSLASADDVIACLNKALLNVPEKESWWLWEPALHYLATANYPHLESLMERACQRIVREVCMPAKLFYLRWTALTKNTKATRELYERLSSLKPVPLEFYFEYAKQELMQDLVKMKKVRRAFEDAISDYGKTEPEVWLRYIKMEMSSPDGDRSKASVLHSRAIVNLPEGVLRDSFTQLYADVISV